MIAVLLAPRACYYKTTSILNKNTEQKKKKHFEIYRPRFSNNMLLIYLTLQLRHFYRLGTRLISVLVCHFF